ncbi:MAG TPA: hypothetical protein QF564_08080 [Pirellulaceae bacterium]|nr:hypothetical protein [Pirellulaceae bacterium]
MHQGSDVVSFVQEMLQCDISHVRFWLADHFGDQLDLKKPKDPKDRPGDEESPKTKAARDETGWTSESSQANRVTAKIDDDAKPVKPLRFRLDLDPASPYLLSDRGFSIEVIKKFGLGLCKRGVLKDYIAIPVYRWPLEDPNENPCGYVGRWPGSDFDEAQGRSRYKVPAGFETSRFIFGLKEAMGETVDNAPLLLAEGPLKAVWLHDRGIVNAVSSFTASVSDEQSDILVATGRPIILCFDGSQDAYDAMRKAAGKLANRTLVRVVRLSDGVEPDDLSADELGRTFDFL